ncbi:hypothetical protein SAMN04487900_1481 [Prevotella communis]|uniref:Uncharacterized protein n=1 Tax=Prevotella communis TaxID=2913614 RepID=A0A1H0L6M2_9BACT|nr:DUF6261 family protein [Prevotella communis]SDO63610.1 hypothetical protein SAMN04487900_1481 [Prevotella communis]
MAYTERFKQIEPFVGKMQRAPHAAHLSWMQRFQERVQTLIVTELGEDCPAMITSQNTALVAAVQAEDEAYRTITRSPLTEQIAEADQVRDNTYIGLRTMVEALGRVGTAAQKDAAPRVLQAMRDYQVSVTENYELESTHIAQLIQQLEVSPLADDCTTLAVTSLVSQLKTENQQVQTLIAQRNEQQAGIDMAAMQRARQQADLVYVETVMVINAFAVVEQQQGVSPYDHAIDVVNQDQEYYVQQVFPRGVKKLKIAANVYFSYYQGQTWREAVDEGLQSNEGWTVSADDEVLFQQRRLLDKQGEPVDAATKVEAGQYSLEAEAQDAPQPDSDVTPVVPE